MKLQTETYFVQERVKTAKFLREFSITNRLWSAWSMIQKRTELYFVGGGVAVTGF